MSFSPIDWTKLVFWLSIGTVAAVYGGYPLLVFLFSRVFGRKPQLPRAEASELPTVSLLIAAYNEELDIEARILNALSLDYPREKLEVVVASDGSTDRTNEIVRRYAARGVRLLAYPRNRGKTTVLNESIPQLRGEVVILSDANTFMAPDAAQRLAAWFRNPGVGVVCGRLILTDPATGRNVDGLYWKYETFLKKCEGRLGALLGANGAIYAIRRVLFPVVRPGTLIDDFVIPLDAKRQSGCQIVYDDGAVAREETAPSVRAEFRRRIRIGAGGFQSIGMLWPLLSPAHGWVALTFLFHKILRWSCPFFLLAGALTNLLLLGEPLYNCLFAAQVGFYATASLGHWLPTQPRWLRYVRIANMFVVMNAALFFGFFRWLLHSQNGTWKRTDRVARPGAEPGVLPAVGAELQTAGSER